MKSVSDIEKTMSVQLTFTHYKEHLAPQWSEHDPSLRVFLDANFDRDPVEFKLNPDNTEATYHIQVDGIVKEKSLSRMAAIGLKGYVTSDTSNGIPCRVSAGTDLIYIADIINRLETHSTYEKFLELRIHSVKNFLKGKIKVRISRGDLSIGSSVRFASSVEAMGDCFVGEKYDMDAVSKKLIGYIGQTIKAKDVLKERDPRTTRIRIPAYLGDGGLGMTNGVPLPACAFLFYEIPKSNKKFWANTVAVVMAREGWKVEDWEQLSRAEQCEIFKATVCYVAQYLPYISDTVDMNTRHARYSKALKIGCEKLSSAAESGSGDCEDLEEAIMSSLDALRKVDLDDQASASLRGVKKMSFQYISGMSLDSVTSGAVTGANDSASSIGAHLNLNLIPADYFKECLERNNPEVSEKLPWEGIDLGDGENLVKVAEGTGMYYSEEHIKDNHYVTSYIYPERCFSTFKKPIYHKQGTHSPFYRQGLTLFVPEFYRLGSNFVGFWYCDKKGYRGASFEDLENRSERVHIMPQPRVPDDVMAFSKEAVKIRPPPMHLELTSLSTDKIHLQAERIKKTINKLERTPNHVFSPAILYITADILGESDADAVIDTLRRKHGVWKVNYVLEDICDALPVGIRFEIYADPTMDEMFANLR